MQVCKDEHGNIWAIENGRTSHNLTELDSLGQTLTSEEIAILEEIKLGTYTPIECSDLTPTAKHRLKRFI